MTPTESRPTTPSSLWTVVVFALLGVVLCSWFVVRSQRVRKQREAVKAIEKLDGEVDYSCEVDEDGFPSAAPEPPSSAWVKKLIGDDLFADVIGVSLGKGGLADDTATYLRMRLEFRKASKVGDSELGHVRRFTATPLAATR